MTTGVFTEVINDKMNMALHSAKNMYESLIDSDIELVREKYRWTFNEDPGVSTQRAMVLSLVTNAYPTSRESWFREKGLSDSSSEETDDDPGDGGAYSMSRIDIRLLMLEEGKYSLHGTVIGTSSIIQEVLRAYQQMMDYLRKSEDPDQIQSSRVEAKKGDVDITLEIALGGSATAILNALIGLVDSDLY